MAANWISNPVSSPPPVLRPVGRYRIDGFRYQALVTVVTRFRNRIMSTLKERLNMKLLMREWPPFGEEKSRWPPSMSPRPAVFQGCCPGATGWAAPEPLRQGRAPNPKAPLSPDAAPRSEEQRLNSSHSQISYAVFC